MYFVILSFGCTLGCVGLVFCNYRRFPCSPVALSRDHRHRRFPARPGAFPSPQSGNCRLQDPTREWCVRPVLHPGSLQGQGVGRRAQELAACNGTIDGSCLLLLLRLMIHFGVGVFLSFLMCVYSAHFGVSLCVSEFCGPVCGLCRAQPPDNGTGMLTNGDSLFVQIPSVLCVQSLQSASGSVSLRVLIAAVYWNGSGLGILFVLCV